jgi:hypothetical protein
VEGDVAHTARVEAVEVGEDDVFVSSLTNHCCIRVSFFPTEFLFTLCTADTEFSRNKDSFEDTSGADRALTTRAQQEAVAPVCGVDERFDALPVVLGAAAAHTIPETSDNRVAVSSLADSERRKSAGSLE